eukprot:420271_1
MMVMYYWLVFLIIFTKSQPACDPACFYGERCCLTGHCCNPDVEHCCPGGCCPINSEPPCGCLTTNNAQKNSEMQDGSVNKTVAHNYYDNWWIIIAIVAVIMVVCCGVALCWLKKVKVKAYGHVGKENEAVEEEMELQETQS